MSDVLVLSEGTEGLGVRVTQTPAFKRAMRQAWKELKPPFTTAKLMKKAWEIYRRGGISDEGLDFVVRRRRYPIMEGGDSMELGIRVSQTPEFRRAMRQAWKELKPPFTTAELMRKAWEIYRRGGISGEDGLLGLERRGLITRRRSLSELEKIIYVPSKGMKMVKVKSYVRRLPRRRSISELATLGEDMLAGIIPRVDLMNLSMIALGGLSAVYLPKVSPIKLPDFMQRGVGKAVAQVGVGILGNLALTHLAKRPDLGRSFFMGSVVIAGLTVIDAYLLKGAIGLAQNEEVSSLSYYVPPEEQVVSSNMGVYVPEEEQVVTEEY